MNKHMIRAVLFLTAAAVCGAVLLQSRAESQRTEITLRDEAERTAWLSLRGWQVGEPAVSQSLVPDTFQTQPGQSWLRLQAAQGLHPEKYAGCEATRYLYPVTNGGSKYVYAELLLCGDILIGAQVYDASTQLMQSVL